MMDTMLLRPHKKHYPPPSKCPKTSTAAMCLCLVSVFFLTGLMIGCYLGVIHNIRKDNENPEPNKLETSKEVHQNEQIPLIDIINNHDNILQRVNNSTIEYSKSCKKEGILDEDLSHFQNELTAMSLFEVKNQFYPVILNHQKIILQIESPKKLQITDTSDNIQLLNPSESLSLEAEVIFEKEISNRNNTLEGVFILMAYQPQNVIRDMVGLGRRGVQGVLLYDPDCSHNTPHLLTHSNPLWQELTKVPHVHMLSCLTSHTLLTSLKPPPNSHPTDFIQANISKGTKLQVSFQKSVKSINSSNIMTTFYGSRDPDFIVLVGASRCNLEGTTRLLKMMTAVKDSLSQKTFEKIWSPYRSIRFISWSPLGVYPFLKTYQEAWKHKVVVYLDLDNPHNDDSLETSTHKNSHLTARDKKNIHFQVSSSLKNFAKMTAKQVQLNNENAPSFTVISSNTDEPTETNAQVLERSMGIPFMKILSLPTIYNKKNKRAARESDKGKSSRQWIDEMILKLFTTTMLSVVDGEHLQISTLETIQEILVLLNQFKAQKFEINKKWIEIERESFGHLLEAQIDDLITSCERLSKLTEDFEEVLSLFSLSFETIYQIRKTNDFKLRVENDLRIILKKLRSILATFNPKHNFNASLLNYCFKDSSSFTVSHFNPPGVYAGPAFKCLKFVEDLNSTCNCHDFWNIGNILISLSEMNLKIQGLSRLTNIRE